jgi:malate dehydrogenase (oxaloacetate-decarboxylating)
MIIAGARRLGELSPALKDPDAALLPDFEESPQVNLEVSFHILLGILADGLWGVGRSCRC